eukprot:5928094-Amphidinium_carterae.2
MSDKLQNGMPPRLRRSSEKTLIGRGALAGLGSLLSKDVEGIVTANPSCALRLGWWGHEPCQPSDFNCCGLRIKMSLGGVLNCKCPAPRVCSLTRLPELTRRHWDSSYSFRFQMT